MHKLPNDIQSLFCASTQISSFKRAVEELVYNSLDAESTSIAIRVNIEELTIQVIDNGHGISKTDFKLIGQQYATSKCVDLSTLKSAPNKYGYRGQSLASIIEISEHVQITSRCHGSEDTWVKRFYKGKEQKISKTTERPSKGTTVEIKGFLYNHKIQRNAITDVSKELNEIKKFLEQLSLVQNNISLSLRDDASHDIVFKLHKNRHIYQTLSSVFGVEKNDVQELSVEKNLYKVTAYIGKKDVECLGDRQWIYLNGKLLYNSKIHKMVNDNLAKALKLHFQSNTRVKAKKNFDQEEDLHEKHIPFYFIFITCPYYDYDVNYTSKYTTLEFKNWDQVNKLIEKLAKFYTGDIQLKEIKPMNNNQMAQLGRPHDTRDQVKKIMDKILGSNPRKLGVSQMQNGVKGKLIKRKQQKENKIQKISLSKVIPKNKMDNEVKNNKHNSPEPTTEISIAEDSKHEQIKTNNAESKKPKMKNKNRPNKACFKKYRTPLKIISNNTYKTNQNDKTEQKHAKLSKIEKISKPRTKHHKKSKTAEKPLITTMNKTKLNDNFIKPKEQMRPKVDPLLKHFQEDPTGSIKKRCNILERKVNDLVEFKKKRKRKVFVNETVQYSNFVRDNKNYSVRKKIDEIVIHEYIPRSPLLSPCTFDGRAWENIKKPVKSSYDLIRSVLRTQEITEEKDEVTFTQEHDITDQSHNIEHATEDKENSHTEEYQYLPKKNKYTMFDESPKANLPGPTFDSHGYNDRVAKNIKDDYEIVRKKPRQFISTKSRDGFVVPQLKENYKQKRYKSILNKHTTHKYIFSNVKTATKTFTNGYGSKSGSGTVFSIEFSKSNEISLRKDTNEAERLLDHEIPNIERGTYTIEQNNENGYSRLGCTYTITSDYSFEDNNQQNMENHYILNEKHDENCKTSNDIIEYSQGKINITSMENALNNDICNVLTNKDINVVFVSKTQELIPNNESLNDVNPLSICEVIHSDIDLDNVEAVERRRNDSLFNEEFDISSHMCDRDAYTQNSLRNDNILDEILLDDTGDIGEEIDLDGTRSRFYDAVQDQLPGNNEIIKINNNTNNLKEITFEQRHDENLNINNEISNFHFRNRPRFVPKGMSPIFENCQTKNVCDYNLKRDYYDKTIYNNFANEVQVNSEIFEEGVKNVKELTTKSIDKVNNKLSKDSASLVFNGQSLKEAEVLNQIDDKFIATTMKGHGHNELQMSEYLVLFDQHAVHERIRLEHNLADYFNGNEWKSVAVDDIKIKVSKDEIVYLHNYKDKFVQLGLQWSISDKEVTLTAIPEAILGKNPRQVETVMKAVESLIAEEINAIRTQSGCISLYPKSIMNLVFSEACRYAIKFGDKISKARSMELLSLLSECKTPFQCAHGRPVMAVLLNIKSRTHTYKINMQSVLKWRNK